MKSKPITSGTHNLTDYAFGIALMTIPKLIGADASATKIYRLLALQIFLYSAFTKQPYALKPLIPMPVHRKIDVGNLTLLGLLHLYRKINANKRTSLFNLGMIALGITTVLLTDWKGGKGK